VHVVSADTDATPMDSGAIASRTTYVTGNAVKLAAEQARKILFDAAAAILGVTPDQLEARDRSIQIKDYPQRKLPIGDVANHALTGIGATLFRLSRSERARNSARIARNVSSE